MRKPTQFGLGQIFIWLTFTALALAAWRLVQMVPESREPFIALAAIVILSFFRVGRTRVVCLCAAIGGLVSAAAYWWIDFFQPFLPVDRLFYIVAYSAMVAAAAALAGMLSTLLLDFRDWIRSRRHRAD